MNTWTVLFAALAFPGFFFNANAFVNHPAITLSKNGVSTKVQSNKQTPTMMLGGFGGNFNIKSNPFNNFRGGISGDDSENKGGNGIFGGGIFGNAGGNGGGIGSSDGEAVPESEPEPESSKVAEAVGLWASYNAMLESKPLLTKALTSFVGFSVGDLLAQKFIDKVDGIQVKRLVKLALFGFLIHGPTGHYFYNFLDSKIVGTEAPKVIAKVFIDQVLWNPIFGIMFFGFMGVADGQGPSAIASRIKNNLVTAVTGSWTVWPIAHAINFKFIPTSQRLLYINSVQIFYNMFLSVISKRE